MLKRLCLLAALAASTATAQDRPVVATVNYPLAWMAERLGGGAVDVLFPVPNGVDPSFWRPGLSDIAAIQQADVIALNGAGFAPWTARSSLPRSRIVDTSAGFSDAYISTESVTHSHGGDGEHSHEGIANYTWLDFAQAAQQAEALAAMMQRRIPDLSDTLAETLPALQADLANLDAEASAAASTLKGQTILATHPRYQYFARAYGLDIIALEWEAGAMPSEAQWAELTDKAASTGASTLIWEATPPAEALDMTDGIGLTSVILHPMANHPQETDFLTAMRRQIAAVGSVSIPR